MTSVLTRGDPLRARPACPPALAPSCPLPRPPPSPARPRGCGIVSGCKHPHVIRTRDQRRRPTACLSMVPLCRWEPGEELGPGQRGRGRGRGSAQRCWSPGEASDDEVKSGTRWRMHPAGPRKMQTANSRFWEEENAVPCACFVRKGQSGWSSGLHPPWPAVAVTWVKATGSDRVAVTSSCAQRQRKEK